ncbi:DUF2946 family protein [Roseovarius sp. S1116L3]|uniref:DUF2946 family protein n=1 Tax=Roseovarius roseus TaxID=3342636 RepID=UPI00372CCC3F
MLSCNRISAFLNAFCGVLLSALLAVQVAMASAPMPADADTRFSMVICSADGLRMVTSGDEDPGDESTDPSARHGHCTLCIQVVDLPGCAGPWQSAGQIETTQRAAITASAQTRGQVSARADGIRAPPVHV